MVAHRSTPQNDLARGRLSRENDVMLGLAPNDVMLIVKALFDEKCAS